MALDVVFVPSRYTGKPITKTNPFTGEEQTFVPHERLNADELKAVLKLLQSKALGPDENGYYSVRSDNGAAEVEGGDLEDGCTVTLRGLSPDIEQFLFELLNAAEWVMVPAMENSVSIATSTKLKELPSTLPKLVFCKSPREIGIILDGGYTAWQKYRDQVAGHE